MANYNNTKINLLEIKANHNQVGKVSPAKASHLKKLVLDKAKVKDLVDKIDLKTWPASHLMLVLHKAASDKVNNKIKI